MPATTEKRTRPSKTPPKKIPRLPRNKRAKTDRHATLQVADGKEAGNNPNIGHVERLNALMKRTFELKTLDYTHNEIAHKVAEEFKLERVPSIVTISNWLDKANFAYTLDIEKLAFHLRIEAFNELEKMKQKWLPLAMADSLKITRWFFTKDGPQPDLDERAVKEQIDATKAVVAIMARQAKLLGLDMEKKLENDKDQLDMNQLQMWIIGQVNGTTPNLSDLNPSPDATAPTEAAVVSEVPADAKPAMVLELRAGRPEIDELEDGSL